MKIQMEKARKEMIGWGNVALVALIGSAFVDIPFFEPYILFCIGFMAGAWGRRFVTLRDLDKELTDNENSN